MSTYLNATDLEPEVKSNISKRCIELGGTFVTAVRDINDGVVFWTKGSEYVTHRVSINDDNTVEFFLGHYFSTAKPAMLDFVLRAKL